MKRYYIETDIFGDTCNELLRFCLSKASTVLFAMTIKNYATEPCKKLLDLFLKLGGTVEQRSEWPGTTRYDGDVADVYTVPVSNALVSKIVQVPSLFSWQLPEYPEDLCILRTTGKPIYLSTTHERYAILDLTDREIEEWNSNSLLAPITLVEGD